MRHAKAQRAFPALPSASVPAQGAGVPGTPVTVDARVVGDRARGVCAHLRHGSITTLSPADRPRSHLALWRGVNAGTTLNGHRACTRLPYSCLPSARYRYDGAHIQPNFAVPVPRATRMHCSSRLPVAAVPSAPSKHGRTRQIRHVARGGGSLGHRPCALDEAHDACQARHVLSDVKKH